MASVIFTYKNGTKRRMPERDAKILQKLKKGSYGNETVKPAPQLVIPEPVQPDHAATAQIEKAEPAADGLDEMDRDQLLKFAEDLEIKIHGRSGEERIREIIREHTK